MSRLFTDFGYEARGELSFPAKSLRAVWFAPPPVPADQQPLPRVFISELKVGARGLLARVHGSHSPELANPGEAGDEPFAQQYL